MECDVLIEGGIPWKRPGNGCSWKDPVFKYPLLYQWCDLRINRKPARRLVKAGGHCVWIPLDEEKGIKLYPDIREVSSAAQSPDYLNEQAGIYGFLYEKGFGVEPLGIRRVLGIRESPVYGILMKRLKRRREISMPLEWDEDALNVHQLASIGAVDKNTIRGARHFAEEVREALSACGFEGISPCESHFDVKPKSLLYDGFRFACVDASHVKRSERGIPRG